MHRSADQRVFGHRCLSPHPVMLNVRRQMRGQLIGLVALWTLFGCLCAWGMIHPSSYYRRFSFGLRLMKDLDPATRDVYIRCLAGLMLVIMAVQILAVAKAGWFAA
jgi:hypothetical protein